MYSNEADYHVDLGTAISIIFFKLIYVCVKWFWNFYVGGESFDIWNTLICITWSVTGNYVLF